MNLPQLVIPDDFPEDVPLDEKFFKKVVTANPWMFLHVWIQWKAWSCQYSYFTEALLTRTQYQFIFSLWDRQKVRIWGTATALKRLTHYSTTRKSAIE